MAVYTKLSENNLKDFFSKYNLGKLLKFRGIQEGIENSNYFIKTDSGKSMEKTKSMENIVASS